MSKQLPHGASTGINGNEAYTIFSEVVNHLENVDARRQIVLAKGRVCVNEKTVQSCCNWIISPQVGGLDEFGYIYKIICYFVHQASDWKESFFKTEYILKEVLEKDCSLKKSDVTSILNLISDADLLKQSRKLKKRV